METLKLGDLVDTVLSLGYKPPYSPASEDGSILIPVGIGAMLSTVITPAVDN